MRYNIPVSSSSLPAIKRLGLRGISCISLTNLDGSPASHEVLQCVADHLGPHLQSLCLGGGSPTEASFVALILGCPALRILDLSGCNSLFTSGMLLAQPETAQRVQQALSGLRELSLASLRDLADLSFNRLSSCAPSLERLSLAYCHLTFELGPARGSLGPQDSSPSQLSFCNLLRFVKERAARLHALDLSGTGLPPEALQALGQVARLRLQELSLHSCRDLSTEAVAALCCQQPGLTSLDLSGCSELADGAILAVSRGLRHLQRLSLRKLQRLTDAGCSALGGLRELQSLDLAECCLLRGRALAQALGSARGAPPPLASLSLAHCSSLKVSVPSPSFLTRARDWGDWQRGTREVPGVCIQGVADRTELRTQAGRGKELRQTEIEGGPRLGAGRQPKVTHTSQANVLVTTAVSGGDGGWGFWGRRRLGKGSEPCWEGAVRRGYRSSGCSIRAQGGNWS